MKLKKIVGLAMASILLMSTMTMTVGAEGDSTGTMRFTTTLNMSKDVITAPNVDFTYTLTAGDPVEADEDHDMYNSGIIEGVSDGTDTVGSNEESLTLTASFSTSDMFAADTAYTSKSFSESTVIDFSGVDFTEVGAYHYVLTATASSVSGIYMDTDDVRDIVVYVVYDGDSDAYVVNTILMYDDARTHTETSSEELKSTGFINSYGIDVTYNPSSEGVTNPDPSDAGSEALEDFVVTAYAAGEMADYTKTFTYALTSTEGIDDGMIFKVYFSSNGASEYIIYDEDTDAFYKVTDLDAVDTSTSTAAYTFELSATDTFTIYSVVDGMSFTVTITDEDGYTMDARAYASTNGAWTTTTAPTDEVTVFTQEVAFSYLNSDGNYAGVNEGIDFLAYANVGIPATGVILQYLPFALLGLLALAFVSFKFYRLSVKR